MRHLCLIIMTAALLSWSAGAFAQVFYEYPAAPAVGENKPVFGPAIAFGDHLFRVNGFARFNISAPMDFGLELVFDNISDVSRFGIGGDLKYTFIPPEDMTMPFDLSFNAGFGYESGGNLTDIVVPLGAIISRSIEIEPSRLLTPYAGVYLLILHSSFDSDGTRGTVSDTNTDVELRGGASFGITEAADIFTALHLGSGTKFYIGLNWHL
jgi:hypothetical protein